MLAGAVQRQEHQAHHTVDPVGPGRGRRGDVAPAEWVFRHRGLSGGRPGVPGQAATELHLLMNKEAARRQFLEALENSSPEFERFFLLRFFGLRVSYEEDPERCFVELPTRTS